MQYVILDLEWDNVFYPPAKRFVNQILQIGAVKLDEDFNIVDTFEKTIKSSISKTVSSRFAELTGITTEKMLSGISLKDAIAEYNAFSDNAEVTMTWSNTDLYTIADNQNVLLKDEISFIFDKYLDLQKLVQGELGERGYSSKNQISLEGAAALLEIDTLSFELHTALDDSLLCAELLKKCYVKEHFESLLRDAKNPDFFARLRYKPRTITSLKDKNVDISELEFLCPKCENKALRMGKFKYRNRWFSSNFRCKNCGYKFSGRVSFKQTFDGIQVKKRICEFKVNKRINKNEVQSVPEKV